MITTVRKRSSDLPLTACLTGTSVGFPLRAVGWEMADHAIHDLHYHDGLELGYCHAGRGLFLVGGAMAPFRAGCCVIVAAGVPHRARSDAGTTSRWTFCWLDASRLLAGSGIPRGLLATERLRGTDFPAIIDRDQHPALSALCCALATEASGQAGQEVLRGLAWAVLAACQRLPGRSQAGLAPGWQRLMPALRAIQGDPSTIPPMPVLARRCGLSPPTLRRDFHAAFGCSPRDYALRLRVQHAAELLRRPGSSVTAIALACGFASASGLARRFRSILGTSPRRWRAG